MSGPVASFAIHAVEQMPVEQMSLPDPEDALRIGPVVISGLDRLSPADPTTMSFVERWQAAMIFQLGAEEFGKFCIARQAREGRHRS